MLELFSLKKYLMKRRVADIPGNDIQITLVFHLGINEQRQVLVSEDVKNSVATQGDKLVGLLLAFDEINNRFDRKLLLIALLFFIVLVFEIAKSPF